MKAFFRPQDPLTKLVPHELFLIVLALANPCSEVPLTSRLVYSTIHSSQNALIQRSWRNRVLLGDGKVEVHDWYTDELNDWTEEDFQEYFNTPHLTRSHLLFMLRTRLAYSSTDIYATRPAPTSAAPDFLVSFDYVAFLYSPNGPFVRRLAALSCDDSAVSTELDKLWDYHFSWRPRLGNGEEIEEEGGDAGDNEDGAVEPMASQQQNQVGTEVTVHLEAVAPKPPEISPYSWWQPVPHAFHVVVYLIRSGQLATLEHALGQLAHYVPNLNRLEARASRWCMLCLDNRHSPRDYFSCICESDSDPFLTFSHFLIVLSLFEWSLPTLEIVMRTLNLSTTDVFQALVHDEHLQRHSTLMITYMTDPDRVIELSNWLKHQDAPFTPFPLCSKSVDLPVFSRLLFDHDLPRAASETDAGTAAIRVQEAICDFMFHSACGGHLFVETAIKEQLLSCDKWAHVLAASARFGSFHNRLFTTVAQQLRGADMWKDVFHKAIMLSLTTLNCLSGRTKLLNLLIAYGVDPVDYLLDQAATWTDEQLVQLFRTSPAWPWSRPSILAHVFDRLIREAPSAVKENCHFFYESAVRCRVHIMCTLFSMCLKGTLVNNTPNKPPSTPDWLLALSHQHLALTMWGYIHVFRPLDYRNVLSLPPPEVALDTLRTAWLSIRNDQPPQQPTPTLSSSLPVPFAHSLYKHARNVTAKVTYEAFAKFPEYYKAVEMMAKLLMDLEPDLILITMDNRELVASSVKDQFDPLDDLSMASLSGFILAMAFSVGLNKIRDIFPKPALQKLPRAKALLALRLRVQCPHQDSELSECVHVLSELLSEIM